MSASKHPELLLILDDRPEVLRALMRFFSLYFERVISASRPEEAEALLEREQPSLLLADYWLGPDHPVGTELIRRWRGEYPFLQRVALMTGTKNSSLQNSEGVDVVFHKPLDLEALKQFLMGEGAPS